MNQLNRYKLIARIFTILLFASASVLFFYIIFSHNSSQRIDTYTEKTKEEIDQEYRNALLTLHNQLENITENNITIKEIGSIRDGILSLIVPTQYKEYHLSLVIKLDTLINSYDDQEKRNILLNDIQLLIKTFK